MFVHGFEFHEIAFALIHPFIRTAADGVIRKFFYPDCLCVIFGLYQTFYTLDV